jgi:hypothetical protein
MAESAVSGFESRNTGATRSRYFRVGVALPHLMTSACQTMPHVAMDDNFGEAATQR